MARAALTARSSEDPLPFLTAWDPSDLPGGSVDPLGFDRGYNCLADEILPGLTNVARLPRYLSLLCAGASLGPETTSPTRSEIEQRQRAVLRLEKFWALANVLAAEADGPGARGVRGVTYAERQRDALAREGLRSSGADFVLLSRQVQYGVLGIYGNIAAGMKLLDRKTLGLTTEYGERLAQAFLAETHAPRSLRLAVLGSDGQVGLDALRAWGREAHVAVAPGREEARILGQALRLDPVRARMTDALARNRSRPDESELERLERIAGKLVGEDRDLAEGIEAILAYERCYRLALLALERILWRCGSAGSIETSTLAADPVLEDVARRAPAAVERFERALEEGSTVGARNGLGRLADVRAFLARLGPRKLSAAVLVDAVLARHADVQQGKLDRGRRKLPWVEVADGVATLTLARAPEVQGEPRRVEDIVAHEYRTASADAFARAEAEVSP